MLSGGGLGKAQKVTKWITERCSKLSASVFAKADYSAVKNYQQEANTTVSEYLAEIKRRIEVCSQRQGAELCTMLLPIFGMRRAGADLPLTGCKAS